METLLTLDGSILLFIQNFLRCPVLDAVMKFFSYIGNSGIFWILLCGIFLFFPKYRRTGLYTLCAIAFCFIINNLILKNWVARIRPYEVVDGLTLIVSRASDWSFPSGHACSSFAAAFMLTKCLGKKGVFSYIIAVLIAFSRLYVGIHYPSDVVAGAVIGTLGSLLVYLVFTKYRIFDKKSE